jgi:hypothetical protein
MPDFGSFRGFGEKLTQGQTPTQLGTIGSIIFGVDPDAQAFFDRVVAAGGSLSANEQIAIDKLFVDLKNYGLYANMKAMYPFVGASSNSCALNMISNTFNCTFNGAITFSSLGISSNGSTGYVSGLCNDFTSRNAYSAGLYINNDGGINGVDMSSVPDFTISPDFNGSIGIFRCEGNENFTRFADVVGFYCNVRPNSTSGKYYRNGSIFTTTTGVTGNSTTNFELFRYGTEGYYTANRAALAYSYNAILSDTDVSNLYTAVQSFQTTLGRQV